MKRFGVACALIAGVAGAQIVPLGAPIIPQPKTAAAPPPSSQGQTGRLKAAQPLGSNYSPYSLQPQGTVTATAPSAMPDEKPVSSGVVSNNDAADVDTKKPVRKAPTDQSDLQKLAPKGAERSELPQADAPPPQSDAPPPRG